MRTWWHKESILRGLVGDTGNPRPVERALLWALLIVAALAALGFALPVIGSFELNQVVSL